MSSVFHVKPHEWWTTYWRLRKRVYKGSDGWDRPTPTQCRKAALLVQIAQRSVSPLRPQGSAAYAALDPHLAEALRYLEWMIDYGKDAFEAELADRKAEAKLGT